MSSGVKVPDCLVDEVKAMKLGKLDQKYTFFIIEFKPSMATPEHLEITHRDTGDYEAFRSKLSAKKDGCFAVVDVPLSCGSAKLVLVSWAPDTLTPKPKMMVASTSGALKGKLEGIDHIYQASDASDLDLKEIRTKVDRK